MAENHAFRPFPLHKVIYHPSMIGAQGSVYRGALCLTAAFWAAQCRDIADDNTTLATLMRMPNGHVSPIRKPLLATFAELATILKADWEAGNQRADNIRRRAQVGGLAAQANKRKARTETERNGASAIPPHAALATPIENEMRRQIERAAAKQIASERARLSDGGSAGEKPGSATKAA